jgi:hypothetical protein
MDDPTIYLADDFDPNKLTLAQLLRILSTHDISLPGTKKTKSFYVALFKDKLLPKRDAILRGLNAQVQSARPPSYIDNTQPKKKPRMAEVIQETRRAKRKATPEAEIFSDDNPFQSGAESTGNSAKKRKVEKESHWKSVKALVGDDFGFPEEAAHSPSPVPEIVRQSSSPNIAGAPTPRPLSSADQIRDSPLRFISPARKPESQRPSPLNQPLEQPQRIAEEPKRVLEQPQRISQQPKRVIQQPKRVIEQPKHVIEEPQARKRIVEPAAIEKKKETKPAFTVVKKQKEPFKWPANLGPRLISLSLQALTLSLIFSTIFYGHDWHQNHLQGFHTDLVKTDRGQTRWNPLSQVLPSTLPCPVNSICEPSGIVECVADYSKEPSWLHRIVPPSKLPFPLNQPKCIYDASKVELERKREAAVKWIGSRVRELTRDYAGKVDCREVISGKPNPRGLSTANAKQSIKKELSRKKSPPSDEEFGIYWGDLLDQASHGVIGNLTIKDGQFLTMLEPSYSFACRIRNQVFGLMKYIVVGIGLWLGQLWVRYKIKRNRDEDELVHDLLNQSLSLLKSRKSGEGGISKDQMRDQFMAHSAPRSTRVGPKGYAKLPDGRIWISNQPTDMNRVWQQVSDLVRRNANVREIDIPVHGELHTGWEWTGLRDGIESVSAEPSPARPVPSGLRTRPVV